ncbi:unnamed protein product [Pylaiella littoralis]
MESDETPAPPTKKKKEKEIKAVPPFLETLQRIYPEECLTKSGTLPRKFKGDYCCQLFSKVRLGMKESQLLRTRTVTTGFASVVRKDKRGDFQDYVDAVVDHLSRVRVLASLFANFVFLSRLNDPDPALQEPDEIFYRACLSACCDGPQGGEMNAEFDRFSSLTGLVRLHTPIKPGKRTKIATSQQITYLAGAMATSTQTRVKVHAEKRRISITRWFLLSVIKHTGGLEYKKYATKIYALAKFIITGFDGTPASISKVTEGVSNIDPTTSDQDMGDVLGFANTELAFSVTVDDTSSCAPTIRHLHRMFDTYARESRGTYNDVVKRGSTQFPGKDKASKKAFGEFIRKELIVMNKGVTCAPPRDTAPLPLCSTRAVFVRIDHRTLKSWGFNTTNDPWWYSGVLSPFSRMANVKCLRNAECTGYASTEEGFLSCLLGDGPAKCPWMIGSSFLTDGLQVKLLLTTLASTRGSFPGSTALDEAGYNMLPRANVPIQELLSRRRGVYNISTVIPSPELPKTCIMSADPGQAKVINVTSALSETWARRDPLPMFSMSSFVSGEDYRRDTGASRSDNYETVRRSSGPYGASISRLGHFNKRTSCIQTFLEYCRSWFRNGPALLNETLNKTRKLFRFSRFRATQKTLAKIADTYMGKATRTSAEKPRVMLFGKASFQAQKGRASAPRKAMIRAMAARGIVLMVNEYNTSKKCPGCFEDTYEDRERRIRSCKNFKIGSPEESCRLHPLTAEYEMDRDDVGSINIGMRGVGLLLGQEWF